MTVKKIAKLTEPGTKVAIKLPVIVNHADDKEPPVYEMDVTKELPGAWREGVVLEGTRTHFYLQVSAHPSFKHIFYTAGC